MAHEGVGAGRLSAQCGDGSNFQGDDRPDNIHKLLESTKTKYQVFFLKYLGG